MRRSTSAPAAGPHLEPARVVAQGQAYHDGRRGHVRRQWAKLSLLANRRMLDGAGGCSVRVAHQDFMLRMWVIDQLGPDDGESITFTRVLGRAVALSVQFVGDRRPSPRW
ncbi:hypothetical protein [Streptomyces sp. NPDC053367]|uniref:hypothetical protein n=1 Tax=Streptomyces sp. NPDC053367 TaxID=3365700 RepID=UPI0037D5CE36